MMIHPVLPGVLNQTALLHLPEHLRPLKDDYRTRALAFQAEQNIRKRAELNHPEDILGEADLIRIVNNLLTDYPTPTLSSPTPGSFDIGNPNGPFNKENLRWLLQHGLACPRYLLRNFDDTGEMISHPRSLSPVIGFVFDRDGDLKQVQIRGSREAQYEEFQRYRSQGFLIERPSTDRGLIDFTKDTLNTFEDEVQKRKRQNSEEEIFTWKRPARFMIFTFKQALYVKEIYRLAYVRINWLYYDPAKYQMFREMTFQKLEGLLKEEGLPPLKFCRNPRCRAILPVLGHRKKYCGESCENAVKNPRKGARRKIKKGHVIKPFEVLSSPPFIPSSQ